MSNASREGACPETPLQRASALGRDLALATERLNQLLHAAQERFVHMQLGGSGGVEMSDGRQLVFRKSGAEWGLEVQRGEERIPVLKASRSDRIAAAQRLEALASKMRENAETLAKELEIAMDAADRFAYPIVEDREP